jgi:hypothetical protein
VTVSSTIRGPRALQSPPDLLVHTSHRYVLPILAGLSLFLGGLLLLQGSDGLVPLSVAVFLSLGVAALGCSVAYLRWRAKRVEVSLGPTAPASTDVLPTLCSQCSGAVPPTLEWEDLFYGRFESPVRAGGAAGSSLVMFTPTSASDRLWVHWLPTEVGQFPVELVGAIAETAYMPPSPDAPLKTESPLEVLPPIYAAPVLGGALVFDPPSDPSLETGVTASPSASAPSARTQQGPIFSPPGPGGVSSANPTVVPPPTADPEPPRWMRTILAEALNPVPPHLREETSGVSGGIGTSRARPDLAIPPVALVPSEESTPGLDGNPL